MKLLTFKRPLRLLGYIKNGQFLIVNKQACFVCVFFIMKHSLYKINNFFWIAWSRV